MNKTDLISYLVIGVCAGMFLGYVLTMTLIKNVFREEFTVKVTPIGLMRDPYKVGYIIKGRISQQEFKVYFRNGVQTNSEWLGYSHSLDINKIKLSED